MTAPKQLWLLAGGNGAGKTTFYQQFLEPRGIRIVNADRIAHTIAPSASASASYEAARIAGRMRDELVNKGVSFCFETVFSHPSKIDFAADTKAHGYEIILVFIHLDNEELNLARVAQRVDQGGHPVPDEKVRSRLPRTLENIKRAIPLADEVYLLDNSSSEDPFKRIATIKAGNLALDASPAPAWALEILGSYLG